MFNYVYPPDFDKASKHRMANRIFKAVDESCQQECECCYRKIGSQIVQTSCNIDPNQLSFLGPGVPLYFLYLRHVIIILLIMSVVFMGFSIYSNASSSDCLLMSECIPNAFNILALVNKQFETKYLSIQSYLSLVFVIAIILLFHYLRFKARLLTQECDEVMDTPSDYAIILRRLPPDTTEKDIMNLIDSRKQTMDEQQLKLTQNLKVIKVIMSYNLKEYTQVKAQNLDAFKDCVKQNKIDSFTPKDLPEITKTSSIAIVVFEHQATKSYFIYKPTLVQKIGQFFCTPCLPLSDFSINDHKISIERAPQPDDICWINSGITMYGAICRKIVYGMIDLLILIVGGGVLYALQLLSQSTADSNLQAALTYGSSIAVTIFNSIILFSLVITTEKERCETLTQFQNTLMVKITLFLFLNAGIFVVIVQIAVSYSTFSLSHDLCSQITVIMLLNAITPNVTLLLLNYFELINRVLRFLVQKQFIIATQLQLNDMCKGPDIDTPYRYAHILKTLLLTALYAPVTPIVVVISMFGLILHYFIEKFLFTRSYCLPNTVSSIIFDSAVQLLQYFLISFAFGQFIVYFYFYQFAIGAIPLDWTICIFLTISLAVLNMFLPMEVINESLFKIQESSHSSIKYSDIQQKIQVTYEMLNPACKTNRKRQNIKDFLGVNKAMGFKSKKAEAELVNFFDLAVTNNMDKLNKQPLLSDLVAANNMETVNKQTLLSDVVASNLNDNNKKTQISEQMKSTGKTPQAKDSSTPMRKDYAKINSENRKNTHPKVQRVVTIGQVEGARQQQAMQAMLFSSKKLQKGEKFQYSFSMWRKPGFIQSNQEDEADTGSYENRGEAERFEEKPQFEYQPMSPRQKQKEQFKMDDQTKKINNPIQTNLAMQYSQLCPDQTDQTEQKSPVKTKPRTRGFNGWKTDKREKPKPKQPEPSKRFRCVEIKNKSKNQENLDIPNEVLPPLTLENTSAKQYIIDPSQFNKNQHQIIDQTYHETFDLKSEFKNSKASIGSVILDNQVKKIREPIYQDPIKQKKATYDPLKLDESYRAFFKQNRAQEAGLLCRSNVRTYVGNSFSKLLITEQRDHSSPTIKINNISETKD